MAKIDKQVRMVFDLNKCVGCQTCSMACKTMWTDRDEGQMYMYWNNVETQPGRGYPKNWETLGGGFQGNQVDLGDDPHVGALPEIEPDYGAAWEYNYEDVMKTDGGAATTDIIVPSPEPLGSDAYASNWDEDVGEGAMPNTHYFYLPRICNHCSKPACLEACPRQSIYKRKEDGIVLIDQDRCRGYRYCGAGCPYKKVYYNPTTKKSEKCIFCYPRLEQKDEDGNPAPEGNFCVTQCVGRVRWVGYDNNPDANVNKLVDDWGVGLRLHPEFGTEPNTFYVPPLSAPTYDADGNVTGNSRIPVEQLAAMFGDTQSQNMRSRIARVEEIFGILETERAKAAAGEPSDLMDILISRDEADRVQLG